MDLPEALSRLEKLEDVLLAQVQELRGIKSEIQKHAVNGTLEPLIDAAQVAQILGGGRWTRSCTGAQPQNPFHDGRQVSQVFAHGTKKMA